MIRIELPNIKPDIVKIFIIAEGTSLMSMSTLAFFEDKKWAHLVIKESRTMEWEGQTAARFGVAKRSFYNEYDLTCIKFDDEVEIEVTIKPSQNYHVDLQTLNHEVSLHVRSTLPALEYLRDCYELSKELRKKIEKAEKVEKKEDAAETKKKLENDKDELAKEMRNVLYRYFFFTPSKGKPPYLGYGNVTRDHINLAQGGTVAMRSVHQAMLQLLPPGERRKLDAEFERDVAGHLIMYPPPEK